MRTLAKQKLVAKATVFGARVPQAELFILKRRILWNYRMYWKQEEVSGNIRQNRWSLRKSAR